MDKAWAFGTELFSVLVSVIGISKECMEEIQQIEENGFFEGEHPAPDVFWILDIYWTNPALNPLNEVLFALE